MALANRFGNLVDVERPLGNQNHIGPTGDAAVQGDPARVASHDFHHHHAVVRLGGRVDAVDRFAYHIARRIKPERVVGSPQIVVDRLGHADHFDSFFMQLLRHRQRVVAADGNQCVDLVLVNRGGTSINAVRTLRRVGARGAQNGSSAGQNSAHRIQVQHHALVFDQTAPALQETHEFIVIVKHALPHHGADDRVQPRAIAPAG